MVVNRGLIMNVCPLNTCQSMVLGGTFRFSRLYFTTLFLETKYIWIKLTLIVLFTRNKNILKHLKTNSQE